jgi:signal transduction histidine kinase
MAEHRPVPGPSRSSEVARIELARFVPDATLDQVFCRACEVSAEVLRVERVGVWLFINERTAVRCANLFERSKNEHSSGAVLRVADFPIYFQSLNIRKAIPAEVAATEPWTAELAETYLKPLNISSMLDAGIFVEGTMVGVVCHEHVGPLREWTTEDRDFAGSVADLLALRIQSAEVRELRTVFQTHRERVITQERVAALEQLAAAVAHDFRNLLTVFLSHGQHLRADPGVPPPARQQAEEIVDAAERALGLTKELMEFARPSTRPPVVTDLGEVTADFLPLLRTVVGARHELRYTRPDALGQVLVDKAQFTRLLLNLVVNARDAMPGGGPITIRLSPVKLTGDPNHFGRYVQLEVIDQGVGMDEETRRRVFEPYFSTKSKGTGLGLAVVRQTVDRAGGFVRADSAPGGGTVFRAFFPRIGATSGATAVFQVPPELREVTAR